MAQWLRMTIGVHITITFYQAQCAYVGMSRIFHRIVLAETYIAYKPHQNISILVSVTS